MIEIRVYGTPAPQGRHIQNRDPNTGRIAPTHSGFGTPEYDSWRSMIKRCYSPSNASYGNYGARGIKVCDHWRYSFKNFLGDVGKRPALGLSLDRINNDGNYEPDNVRWTDKATQQKNRRNVRRLEFAGQCKCLTDWSKATGLPRSTIQLRLRLGWSVEKTLSTPSRLDKCCA